MPLLKNIKHELFAQALADGVSSSKAYTDSGYKSNQGNACTLRHKPDVFARVQEILVEREHIHSAAVSLAVEQQVLTVTKILDELEEARTKALAANQLSAAVSATMGRARVAGLIIDRKEVGQPGEFDRMNEDELRRYITQQAKELGVSSETTEAYRSSKKPDSVH